MSKNCKSDASCSLIYQLTLIIRNFFRMKIQTLINFLNYWESIKDLPEDMQKKLLDAWEPNFNIALNFDFFAHMSSRLKTFHFFL